MKQSPTGILLMSKAIVGFTGYKSAEGLSNRTIESYELILNKWLEWNGDVLITKIKSQNITCYLNWLRNDYVPQRITGKTHPLSPKTIRNIFICLSSFFSWASIEFQIDSPIKNVPPPKFSIKEIIPFSKDDIDKILRACVYSREADTVIRKKYSMRRPTANRDRALIMALLDTGLRASELCALRICDLDIKTGRIEVRHGVGGGAKGGKGRSVYVGKTTRRAIWRYLSGRDDQNEISSPLFLVEGIRRFNPDSLRHLIVRLATKSGVQDAHPHRFRHSFAIIYLRSGGDIFTLQELLGHRSLEMVRHYSHIAQLDIQEAFQRASPVDNLRL
jgi:integrase/recombinase XerD